MTITGKICLLGILLLLSGCSTAPVKLKGHQFESNNLSEVMADRTVAFKSRYVSRFDGGNSMEESGDRCAEIRDGNKFEGAVSAWAPKQVDWARRTSKDVSIYYSWTCDSVFTGLDGFTELLSLLSLRILPVYNNLRLRLNVSISQNRKTIFEGDYLSYESVWMNRWFDEEEEYFGRVADALIEKYIIELDRDGGLEL